MHEQKSWVISLSLYDTPGNKTSPQTQIKILKKFYETSRLMNSNKLYIVINVSQFYRSVNYI